MMAETVCTLLLAAGLYKGLLGLLSLCTGQIMGRCHGCCHSCKDEDIT